MGATRKSWFRRNQFFRVPSAQFIRYLKNFYKVNLDINKPLALYVRIFSAKGTLKFLRITYARTHQEVSHKTKLIGLCLLLRLWIFYMNFFQNLVLWGHPHYKTINNLSYKFRLYTKSGAWKNSNPGFLFLYAKRQISNIIKVYKNN